MDKKESNKRDTTKGTNKAAVIYFKERTNYGLPERNSK
jgi:hypothetical protein